MTMKRDMSILESVISKIVQEELSSLSKRTSRQVAKVARLAELLQQEIGRIDDPGSMTPEDHALMKEVRKDVESAFSRLKVGFTWKVVKRGIQKDEFLGTVYAASKDDAFEEAMVRWGDSHHPSTLEVIQVAA